MKPIVLALLLGCSAPQTLDELATAERRADAGDTDGAIAAYQLAQQRCGRIKPARRAKAACADAFIGEAEVIERAGQTPRAVQTYLAIPGKLPDDAATSAIAIYRAGELLLRAQDTTAAWTALWRVITEYPDEAPAGDALRTLLADGRGRDAKALANQLQKLITALAGSEVADNLLWSLADLYEHELGQPSGARALYDRVYGEYPKSGLRDDARWHAARISRALGDAKGAVERLRGLLKTREVAIGAGSYFSIWLDDAQLELGKVLRDDLADLSAAAAAFRKLPKDYPASILKDDALYELAVTLEKSGDHAGACKTLEALAKQSPDSKYVARGKETCP